MGSRSATTWAEWRPETHRSLHPRSSRWRARSERSSTLAATRCCFGHRRCGHAVCPLSPVRHRVLDRHHPSELTGPAPPAGRKLAVASGDTHGVGALGTRQGRQQPPRRTSPTPSNASVVVAADSKRSETGEAADAAIGVVEACVNGLSHERQSKTTHPAGTDPVRPVTLGRPVAGAEQQQGTGRSGIPPPRRHRHRRAQMQGPRQPGCHLRTSRGRCAAGRVES